LSHIPNMKIVVDTREHDFIEILKMKIDEYPHIDMEVSQLDLGDIEIHYKDTKLLIWERKTFADLLHSVKDGRYAEQSHRLLNEYGANKIVYLIEGILTQLRAEDRKVALSTMTSLAFFKGVHLWRSVHTHDSVDQILACCNKLYKEYERGNTFETVETEPVSYCKFVKKEKKQNITPENIGEIFLCQIPGIRHNTAVAIMEKYNGDFSQLMEIVKTNPKELNDIYIGKEKPRRIAKNLVAKLVEFLGA
jgi:ERCC4-type nuclease